MISAACDVEGCGKPAAIEVKYVVHVRELGPGGSTGDADGLHEIRQACSVEHGEKLLDNARNWMALRFGAAGKKRAATPETSRADRPARRR